MSKFKIYVKSIFIPIIVGGFVGLLISNFIDYNSLRLFNFIKKINYQEYYKFLIYYGYYLHHT